MVLISLPLFLSALALSALAAPAAPDPGARVSVRIEGPDSTLFDGFVFTRGHNITTKSGGEHHCDGTNHGAHPEPGPTATGALDTAAREHQFEWDATFFDSFDDFFITSIFGVANSDSEFWGIVVNYQISEVGGCQKRVEPLDEVLWAWDLFSKSHILKISGPAVARVHQAVTLIVKDGSTGNPIAGAEVNGETTDANGEVLVTFDHAEIVSVKAEKADSIRSNSLKIAVLP